VGTPTGAAGTRRRRACVRSLYAAGASSITRRSASHTIPSIARTMSSCTPARTAFSVTLTAPDLPDIGTCHTQAPPCSQACAAQASPVRSTAAQHTGLISALARVRLILRPAPCEHEFQDFGLPLPRTTNDPVPAPKRGQASQLLKRTKSCRSWQCNNCLPCCASDRDPPQPLSLMP